MYIKVRVRPTYHDCQGRSVHKNVEYDAQYSDNHRPVFGGVKAKHGNEDHYYHEHEFNEKKDENPSLVLHIFIRK